ncbi:MAG: type I restriction endonuclease, partial [Dehalococcoidia bacterium]
MQEYSEAALVEAPAIALFKELGWEHADCFHETFEPYGTMGRATKADVILVQRLRPALDRLNPDLPSVALDLASNDFFLASQFWASGRDYTRRADLVGFVNGLPLVFIELKAVHRRLEDAYRNNLTDYKDAIPQLFW